MDLFLAGFDELINYRHRLVINSKDDFLNANLCESFYLVSHDWLVAKFNQRLRCRKGQGAQSSAKATNQNKSFHLEMILFAKIFISNALNIAFINKKSDFAVYI